MNKSYIITFGISVLVLATIGIIALMLFIPQQVNVIEGNINKYEKITRSDFTFESTKDISKEALMKEYSISADELAAFRARNQYKPGNSDPFAPKATSTGNTGSSQANSNTAQSANDKTTNSNGGVANPSSTNK